jgi:16S rRNA (cytidine1402-2'-O)-methyltransferase
LYIVKNGSIYLIPLPLSPEGLRQVAAVAAPVITHIRHFIVENTRTARRFLRAVNPTFPIDDCVFIEMDKHGQYAFDKSILQKAIAGNDIGLMSEAGCPAVADPGHLVVAAAHALKIKVIPLPGPNAMIMALMSSGFNGQQFTFNGYVPLEPDKRKQLAQQMERLANADHTQIFMDTPYRNQKLLEDLCKWLQPDTSLCIASNISASNETIKTMSIREWSAKKPDLSKIPVVFVMGKKI